jgi:excisionase family DNA binding protein
VRNIVCRIVTSESTAFIPILLKEPNTMCEKARDPRQDLEDLRMLTVKEVSELLRLSKTQISYLLRSGQLPGVQFRVGYRAKWLVPTQQLREAITKRQRESAEARDEACRKLDEVFSRDRRPFSSFTALQASPWVTG